ncbi:hypothetical protein [Streptomyces sp. NPDC001661]
MYEAELVAVATGAAGTLVAAIATSGAQATKAQVMRFFRHGTPGQQRAAIQEIDDTTARLGSSATDAHGQSVRAWAELITQYVIEHREAVDEIGELTEAGERGTVRVWNQHNTGSGTFIGGDVHGGLTLHHGGTPDGQR